MRVTQKTKFSSDRKPTRSCWRGSWADRGLFAGILHDFVGNWRWFDARSMVFLHKDNLKCALCQHAGELSLAVVDSQRLSSVIPMEPDGGKRAFFVVVVIVLVFVESEIAVGATKDAKFDGISRLLGRPLN